MIPDLETQLSTDLAITDAAVASENALKFPETNPDKGEGTPVRVRTTVKEAFATADACTLIVQIQDSADDSTYATIAESKEYAASELTLGTIIDVYLPAKHRQYVRAYNVPKATTSFSAGKVDQDLIAG